MELLTSLTSISLIAVLICIFGCTARHEGPRAIKHTPPGSEHSHIREPKSPSSKASEQISAPAILIEPATYENPVTAGMAVIRASKDQPDIVDVWIKLLLAGGFHIIGQVDAKSPFQPLSIELKLPCGATIVESCNYSASSPMNAYTVYRGSVLIRKRVRYLADADSPIEATVRYQGCNEDACFPAAEIRLSEFVLRRE